MIDVLKTIAEVMKSLNIGYAFERFDGDAPDPYWVGEYVETPGDDESGLQESEFILTGTTHGNWIDLERDKDLIERAFPPVGGWRGISDDGNGLAIWYSYSQPVPVDVAGIKRIEVHLTVKQWKVI